jgi:hypothetical protein
MTDQNANHASFSPTGDFRANLFQTLFQPLSEGMNSWQ